MIRFDHVSLSYGASSVLEDVTFEISPGGHAAVMGPSGCGKTTLLQLAAGLLKPSSGTVSTSGRVAYAFQDARLLPWCTAAQNVNAVLSSRGGTLPQALHWLEAVGLQDDADKLPGELSGGQRQRVNLARALAYQADILLFDEPTQGLDEKLREHIWTLLREQSAGKTLLLATHDAREADALADAVYAFQTHPHDRRMQLTKTGVPKVCPGASRE